MTQQFNIKTIRQQFPILARQVNNKPLAYLDNGATTQKPKAVIEAISDYYQQHNSNVHRGVHHLSDESTTLWEKYRQQVAAFFGATPEQLIVTRNTTEALNILALGWGGSKLHPGDVIAVGLSEHHSNFVPWQVLAQQKQLQFVVVPLADDGQLDYQQLENIVKKHYKKLKVLALTQVSNTLGAVADLPRIDQLLRKHLDREQVLFCVDGAQAAAHLPVDFANSPADAWACSAHKMYGPMGIGGLLLKSWVQQQIQPVLLGGGMIDSVTVDHTTYNPDFVERFTAGTPDVASMVGWAKAVEFLSKIGWDQIMDHEAELMKYGLKKLASIKDIEVVGPLVVKQDSKIIRTGALTFLHRQYHAHDVAQVLDRFGVAVRSGHHCTMPLHLANDWTSTTRASFGIYNTAIEIDTLVEGLQYIPQVFGS